MASEAFQTFWPWNVRSDFESLVVSQRNWSIELVDTGIWFKPRKGMSHVSGGTWSPFKHLCLLFVEESGWSKQLIMWGNELQDLNFSYFTAGLGGSGPVNLLILVSSRSWMSCIFCRSVEIDTTHTIGIPWCNETSRTCSLWRDCRGFQAESTRAFSNYCSIDGVAFESVPFCL